MQTVLSVDDSADEVNTSSSQNDRAATPVPGPSRAATPGTIDRPDTPRSAGTPGAVGTEHDTPTTGRTDHNQPGTLILFKGKFPISKINFAKIYSNQHSFTI